MVGRILELVASCRWILVLQTHLMIGLAWPGTAESEEKMQVGKSKLNRIWANNWAFVCKMGAFERV